MKKLLIISLLILSIIFVIGCEDKEVEVIPKECIKYNWTPPMKYTITEIETYGYYWAGDYDWGMGHYLFSEDDNTSKKSVVRNQIIANFDYVCCVDNYCFNYGTQTQSGERKCTYKII